MLALVLVLFVFNFLCKIEDLLKQETIVIIRVRVISSILVDKERSRGKSTLEIFNDL